jgi:L-ascorbate metabolism protein UlaG (beta-lactamase superfamily)
MNINWYGQSCFRIESKDVSVLIDPFHKDIGLRPPKVNDTIVLVTHQHFDHSNVEDLDPAKSFLISTPGEYEKAGVNIQGILSFHDNEQGASRGYNTIYIVRMEGIVMCHLGDLGQKELTKEQLEELGNIDILFIPVGGNYTIDGKQAVNIIKQMEPKVIIPMHYKIPAIQVDLDGPEKFIKEIGMTPEVVDTYKILEKNLPTDEMKLVTFQI